MICSCYSMCQSESHESKTQSINEQNVLFESLLCLVFDTVYFWFGSFQLNLMMVANGSGIVVYNTSKHTIKLTQMLYKSINVNDK